MLKQKLNFKLFNLLISSISHLMCIQNTTVSHTVHVVSLVRFFTDPVWWKCGTNSSICVFCLGYICCQAEEERDGMEKVKLDNRRILFNLLPAHVAQHFLMSNPRNMVSLANRHADRQTDKQVDKQTENKKWWPPEDIKGHFFHWTFFPIRIYTISPTHKLVSCLPQSQTSMISTSSWMETTWEWSAWDYWMRSLLTLMRWDGNSFLDFEHRNLGDLNCVASFLCAFIWMYLLQLMDKECYKDIEKIKTIGSTYMAAVGLVPTIGTKVACHFVFLCVFLFAHV